MQVVIDIPDKYFLDTTVGELTERLKLYTALLMYQKGELSSGAACEFAEVNRYTFMTACKQHNISLIDYDVDDVDSDFQALKK